MAKTCLSCCLHKLWDFLWISMTDWECMYTPNYPPWAMHVLLYTFRALRNSLQVKNKQRPQGVKTPIHRYLSENCFTKNHPTTPLDTFQYPPRTMHVLLYTFRALRNSLHAKKSSNVPIQGCLSEKNWLITRLITWHITWLVTRLITWLIIWLSAGFVLWLSTGLALNCQIITVEK